MGADPLRRVEGRTLVSDRMPAIRIEVAGAFEYVDRLRFVLYGVARVESFLFVAHHHQRVTKLLLVQFEGYLDDNDHVYDYPITETVTLGRHAYLTDTALVTLTPPTPPDSDVGRAIALLNGKGYALPAAGVGRRFVRLLDDARRNELLILYGEDLRDVGLTAEELAADERFAEWWAEIVPAVHDRALRSFTIRDNDEDVSVV